MITLQSLGGQAMLASFVAESEAMRWAAAAVSYTHLTLPTILRV